MNSQKSTWHEDEPDMWVGDMITCDKAHLVDALITKWEGGKERLLQRKTEDPNPGLASSSL